MSETFQSSGARAQASRPQGEGGCVLTKWLGTQPPDNSFVNFDRSTGAVPRSTSDGRSRKQPASDVEVSLGKSVTREGRDTRKGLQCRVSSSEGGPIPRPGGSLIPGIKFISACLPTAADTRADDLTVGIRQPSPSSTYSSVAGHNGSSALPSVCADPLGPDPFGAKRSLFNDGGCDQSGLRSVR